MGGVPGAFDRAFLQMMTAHHQGAIQMAQTELADGQNPEAKPLAQKIISAQQGGFTQMNNIAVTTGSSAARKFCG